MGVIDSYYNVTPDDYYGTSNTAPSLGQSFTGNGKPVGRAYFSCSTSRTFTGNVTCSIYAHTGTFGSTGLPTGSALATSQAISVATVNSATWQTRYFIFDGLFTTVNGTRYFVVLNAPTSTSTLNFQVETVFFGTDDGNAAEMSSSGVWSTLSSDILFGIEDTDYGRFMALF